MTLKFQVEYSAKLVPAKSFGHVPNPTCTSRWTGKSCGCADSGTETSASSPQMLPQSRMPVLISRRQARQCGKLGHLVSFAPSSRQAAIFNVSWQSHGRLLEMYSQRRPGVDLEPVCVVKCTCSSPTVHQTYPVCPWQLGRRAKTSSFAVTKDCLVLEQITCQPAIGTKMRCWQ